ncbi:aminoglycoside phosphotransferase family protein [Streptomyces thinghirensis]|nr:aminoglycoside phosphotransferase family protein [Streptomyces thinghirensis]
MRSLPEAEALLEAAGDAAAAVGRAARRSPFRDRGRADRAAGRGHAGGRGWPAPRWRRWSTRRSRPARNCWPRRPRARLLHGTFRQSKVLAGDRMPWLAVGPDPVVGESAFDLARLVQDRVEDLIAQPSGASTTRRRVKRLAESLEVDQERLRGWTLFRAVESGVRARRVGQEQDAELLLEFASWL